MTKTKKILITLFLCVFALTVFQTAKAYSSADFSNLAADWLKNISGSVADLNKDGIVNTRDLGMIMYGWGNSVDTTPPSTPSAFQTSYLHCGAAVIDWNRSTDAGGSGLKGYNIYGSDNSLVGFVPADITIPQYEFKNFPAFSEPYKDFGYSAKAIDNAGNESALVTGTVKVFNCANFPLSFEPIGEQKTAVLLLTYPGGPGTVKSRQEIWNIARDSIFGTSDSLNEYFKEASYGKMWLTGDVYGWYEFEGLNSPACFADPADTWAAIKDKVDFSKYNRFITIEMLPLACHAAGSGSSSGGARQQLYRNGSSVYPFFDYFPASEQHFYEDSSVIDSSDPNKLHNAILLVSAHEGGHELGLGHAKFRYFSNEPLGPIGTEGAYRGTDYISTMGSAERPGHYTAPHKAFLGWLNENEGSLKTIEASGEYQIMPYELAVPGLKALKIRRGTGNDAWLWVEYRQKIGFDYIVSSNQASGAMIHYEDPFSYISSGGKERASNLLDFNPSTYSTPDGAALKVGQTWTDPYSNLSLTVKSATSAGLTIQVDYR
jgi:M6 family metalloprotease-like protein